MARNYHGSKDMRRCVESLKEQGRTGWELSRLSAIVVSDVESPNRRLRGLKINILRAQDLGETELGIQNHEEIARCLATIGLDPIIGEISVVKPRKRIITIGEQEKSVYVVEGILDSATRGIIRAIRYDLIEKLLGHESAVESLGSTWKPAVEVGIVSNEGQERGTVVTQVCGNYDYAGCEVTALPPRVADQDAVVI